jgi:two-component system, OmpR family, sensor histidine kinase VicK
MLTPGNFPYLEQLVQRSQQIVFVYNPADHQFLFLNQAFEKIWDIPIPAVLNEPSRVLSSIHPEDSAYLRDSYEKFMNGATETDVEFRITGTDNSTRWIGLSPQYISDEEGKPLIAGYAEDITRRKEYITTAFKYSSKKNSILETLSHDLMGQLTMMKNVTSLLRTKLQLYNDANLNELAEIVEAGCGRNSRYLREFLHQEYLDSANLVVNIRRINLQEKVADALEQYRSMPGNQTKHFQLIASGPEMFAEVDEIKFIQVINNLLSNAIKFTADDGIITVRVDGDEETAQITVADNGIGIPEHLQPRVFEKFTPARRPGLRGEETTGLGMSIVKRVVELHRGQIWLESAEHTGTTLYITIPRQQPGNSFI